MNRSFMLCHLVQLTSLSVEKDFFYAKFFIPFSNNVLKHNGNEF